MVNVEREIHDVIAAIIFTAGGRKAKKFNTFVAKTIVAVYSIWPSFVVVKKWIMLGYQKLDCHVSH